MSRAFTIIEMVVAILLLILLIGSVYQLFAYSTRSSGRLTSQLALQQQSRKALARLMTELQEGMEVLSPPPGHSLSYALVRDKVSAVRWYYLVPRPGSPGSHDLMRHASDLTLPVAEREAVLLEDVHRLTFTCTSEGALRMNVVMAEEGREYALLTSVRLRNLAAAEELW